MVWSRAPPPRLLFPDSKRDSLSRGGANVQCVHVSPVANVTACDCEGLKRAVADWACVEGVVHTVNDGTTSHDACEPICGATLEATRGPSLMARARVAPIVAFGTISSSGASTIVVGALVAKGALSPKKRNLLWSPEISSMVMVLGAWFALAETLAFSVTSCAVMKRGSLWAASAQR